MKKYLLCTFLLCFHLGAFAAFDTSQWLFEEGSDGISDLIIQPVPDKYSYIGALDSSVNGISITATNVGMIALQMCANSLNPEEKPSISFQTYYIGLDDPEPITAVSVSDGSESDLGADPELNAISKAFEKDDTVTFSAVFNSDEISYVLLVNGELAYSETQKIQGGLDISAPVISVSHGGEIIGVALVPEPSTFALAFSAIIFALVPCLRRGRR